MSDKKDALGSRMKGYYEDRYRIYLPRSTYTIVRIDGKAFHTYTKNADKPFDADLEAAFSYTVKALCEEMQGAKFAYLQSDEISILLTDFELPGTQAWFDGNLQKIVSVSASCATQSFNDFIRYLAEDNEIYKFRADAMFDARAFIIPSRIEVENYFIWRQQDWKRNSINMLAETYFSASELLGLSSAKRMEKLLDLGPEFSWEGLPLSRQLGRLVVYKPDQSDVHGHWYCSPAFPFVEERDKLTTMIPAQLTWPRGPWSNTDA